MPAPSPSPASGPSALAGASYSRLDSVDSMDSSGVATKKPPVARPPLSAASQAARDIELARFDRMAGGSGKIGGSTAGGKGPSSTGSVASGSVASGSVGSGVGGSRGSGSGGSLGLPVVDPKTQIRRVKKYPA